MPRETSRNFLGNPTKLPKCWISFREIGYSPFSDTPTCCQMMRKSVIVVSLIGSNHYHQPSLKAKLCLLFQISPTIIYLSFIESAWFFFNPGHKDQRRASTSDCRGMNFYISWKSITYTPGKKNIGASQIFLVPGCTGHPKITGLPPKIVQLEWSPMMCLGRHFELFCYLWSPGRPVWKNGQRAP